MNCSELLQSPRTSSFTAVRRASDPAMRPRLGRIIYQLTETGTARLIFNERSKTLRGVLINQAQDTFSIYARPLNLIENPKLPPPTEYQMQITIVDGETGEKFEIDDVTISTSKLTNPITSTSHSVINIDHPVIKFQTTEVLIGNRADVEVSQYIDPKLSPSSKKKVLIGSMSLKVVVKEKNETLRRISESVSVQGSDVIEHTSDFLA